MRSPTLSQSCLPSGIREEKFMTAMRKVLAMAAVVAAATLGVVAVPNAASATTRLGGVDMQAACNAQYPGLGSRATVTDPSSAYSWRCVTANASYGIDVNRACATQWWPGAYAGLGSSTNPYSWYCQGPACYGARCVHVNPGGTDCAGANGTELETVTAPGGGARIVLKWSAYCHANWARWVSGTSDPGYWDYWVQTYDGHSEGKTFNQSYWTYMVNGNLLARACIRGSFDPTPACTGWH
jgi:Protein of unknown function (DUF2690)